MTNSREKYDLIVLFSATAVILGKENNTYVEASNISITDN